VGDALQHCLKAFIFLADLPVGSAFLKIKKLVDNKRERRRRASSSEK